MNLGKKFNFSRENSSNPSIQVNKKKIVTRCKSGGNNNPNNGNHLYGANILNFNYNNNFEGFLNKKIINKDLKPINEQAQTKKSYIPILINDKENENKLKKSSIHTIFGSKNKRINNNSKFQKNEANRNGPITIDAKNIINSKMIGFDKIGNNYKNDFSNINLKEKQNAFLKKIDENYNINIINSNENYLNSLKLKNEDIKPKVFTNKNLDVELYKVMNNLNEKEKNLEFNINKNENIKINEQINEIKELKKNNEQYKL